MALMMYFKDQGGGREAVEPSIAVPCCMSFSASTTAHDIDDDASDIDAGGRVKASKHSSVQQADRISVIRK